MARTDGGELRDALERLLASQPGLTARGLASALKRSGLSVDKSRVNAVLYSHAEVFSHDGGVPPAWRLASQAVTKAARSPLRLHGLRLENWKSFESVTVPVNNITLLFGENSSGKSSLIQALLLMQRSFGFESLQLGAAHGWYAQVVHRHDIGRTLRLVALWGDNSKPDASASIWFVAQPDEDSAYEAEYCPVAQIALSDEDALVLLKAQRGTAHELASGWFVAPTPHGQGEGGQPPGIEVAVLLGVDEAGWPDFASTVPIRESRERSVDDLLSLTKDMLTSAGEALGDVLHVGPYRWVPERDIEMDRAVVQGPWLAELHGNKELLLEVNEWLTRFRIPYGLEIVRYGSVDDGGEVFELSLTRGDEAETVQLVDVGFGVSQLLPIITMLLGSRERTILVEEPEAHVHPRLQSVLGDLFVTSAQDYGNVLVVETHSEPILLRLQRRVAEGRLSHEELGVLHVERDGLRSRISEVPVLASGQLDYTWPGGFFDDRMDDLVALMDPRPEV